MLKSKRFPGTIYALIVALLILTFGGLIVEVNKDQRSCLTAYDGFGYYMYLPALFTQGSLKIDPEWAKELQGEYCPGIPLYQLTHAENGNFLDIYHMGLSVVEAPSFLVAHLIAKIGGYPEDGMSKPYHYLFIINAFVFAVLGIYYLRKLLLLFFEPGISALIVFLVFCGTNYWITATKSFDLQHLYLFTLVTAFFYFLLKYQKSGSGTWKAAFLLGLIVLIRPTHILLGLFPVVLLFSSENKRKWFREMLVFGIIGFVCQLPQLFYWKLVGGHWFIPNLHTENLVLSSPHLADFLFSYRKGWLLYTPLFLLLIPGFMFMRTHFSRLTLAIVLFLIIDVWVVSSWDCWWYAASFGQRPMVDIYGILAIPLGFALTRFPGNVRILPMIFAGLCLVLSAVQSRQYTEGIISPERMTGEQYWAVFGKLDKEKISDARLLLDRSDVNWPDNFDKYWELGYKKSVKSLAPAVQNLCCLPNSYTQITLIEPMRFVSTDEANFEVTCNYNLKNSNSAELLLEMNSLGKTYQWNKLILKGDTTSSTMRFNLPDIRNKSDQLNVVLYNPTTDTLYFKNLEFLVTELRRKEN